MKNLSKSRYTTSRQCSKALWLSIYKPDEAKIDDALKARFEAGNVIGDLAMDYLGPHEEVTALNADGRLAPLCHGRIPVSATGGMTYALR